MPYNSQMILIVCKIEMISTFVNLMVEDFFFVRLNVASLYWMLYVWGDFHDESWRWSFYQFISNFLLVHCCALSVPIFFSVQVAFCVCVCVCKWMDQMLLLLLKTDFISTARIFIIVFNLSCVRLIFPMLISISIILPYTDSILYVDKLLHSLRYVYPCDTITIGERFFFSLSFVRSLRSTQQKQ